MPWSDSYFPRSMLNLPQGTRHKAIEIANALLAQGCEEGRAIRIGISQARRWADSRAGRRLDRPHRARGSLQ
jgi:uncharacterized protein YdaT